MKQADSELPEPSTWTDQISHFAHEHAGEIALGAAAAALLIAGRGRLVAAAESYLPKVGAVLEDGAATELGFVRQSAEATTAGVNKLHFSFDPAKIAESFGPDARALPSMSVVGKNLEQRIAIVNADSAIAKTYEQANPSIFSLHELRGEREVKVGTAFLTEDNYLATAQHCVSDSPGLFVRIGDGERLPLSVAAKDFSADVALLKFKGPVENLPPGLKLGWGSSLKTADPVANLGYPASSNRLVMTDGLVTDIQAKRVWTGTAEKADTMQLIAPSAKIHSRAIGFGGSSGAPIMADGEVVGVHVASSAEEGVGRSTAIEHVRLLLDLVRKNPIPEGGLEVQSIGRVLGNGKTFKITVEKLTVALENAISKP